jgi:hypothetical protein
MGETMKLSMEKRSHAQLALGYAEEAARLLDRAVKQLEQVDNLSLDSKLAAARTGARELCHAIRKAVE